MVQVQQVSKIYKMGRNVEVKALQEVSFSINDGEMATLVGASGSGKSTMLNILGGLDRTYQGQFLVDNKDIKEYNQDFYRRTMVGTIFQQFNLISSLSVAENILLPVSFGGQLSRTESKDKLHCLLKKVGLLDRINHKPTELSGGQMQRVAIARALISNPKILLADEPTGNLDSKTGQDIMNLLEDINREQGMTMIIVTHDQELALTVQKKIFLRDGQVVKETQSKSKKYV